jgi:hypothetical protein
MTPAQQAVKEALEKAAAYVAATQPQLDKQAAERKSYVGEVSRATSRLAELGAIDPSKQNALVEKLASSPAECAKFLVALAEKSAAPQGLGGPAEVKTASELPNGFKRTGRPLSASDRAVLYGDPSAEVEPMDTGHVS